ncbi:MAG TPA: DUF1801 domain-containing protein [Anaerolineales bacterium]|nr:DUF1801 domain-containing protein [Anaerolineales bacterium]
MPTKSSVASQTITKYIAGTKDWQGKRLTQLRALIRATAPELTEDWKWGVPVWTYNGLVCSIGGFKDHVKLNFFLGARLKDPKRLFNSGLEAKAMRAIDFHEGDKMDEAGVKALIRAAVALNTGATKK